MMFDALEEETEHTEFLSTKSKLLKRIDFNPPAKKSKVTIVGLTKVGLASAMIMSMQSSVQQICCLDNDVSRIEAETNDLYHAAYFAPKSIVIHGGSDYSLSANSDICIITTQCSYDSNKENILNLAEKNTEVFKVNIPKLIEYSPNTILLIITEPNNIMTYVAWRISKLPRHRVLGIGTIVDSSKFRYLIARHFDITPSICNGWIIGDTCENGGIPLWNSVGFSGSNLKEIIPDFETNKCNNIQQLFKLPDKIVQAKLNIKKYKSNSDWGIALACARIVTTILSDSMTIFSISCYAEGYMGINEKVFLSLPCLVGSKGCISILQQNINNSDVEKLKSMAKSNVDIQINLILVTNY